MSHEFAHPARSAERLGRWLTGREGLSWMVSLLGHGGMMLLMLLVWFVVVRPRPPRQDAPVRLMDLNSEKLSGGGAPLAEADQLQIAGPQKRPGASAWRRLAPVRAITPRGAQREGRTGERVPIDVPGGGPDDKPRLPRGPEADGLIPGRPPGRGPGGEARIVYVLDGSGSMLDGLDAVRRRLLVDLSWLAYDEKTGRGNRFNVIFFREGAEAFWPGGLLPATDSNKIKAARWVMRIQAVGGTDPIPALKMAFSCRPDTIVVLSDGEFDRQVLDTVRRLQAGRRIPAKIYAVAFGKDFPAENLAELASRNGGRFVRLGEDQP